MEDTEQIATPVIEQPDPPQGDPVETYYNYLKKAGADVAPDLGSFKRTLGDDTMARKYYRYLRSNHFDAPDTYESFAKTLNVGLRVVPVGNAYNPVKDQSPASGPTPQQTKAMIRDYRNIGQSAGTMPEVSKNPATKPFAALENIGNQYVTVSNSLNDTTHPALMSAGEGGYVDPDALNTTRQQLQQQVSQLKPKLQQEEAGAEGTLKDIDQRFLKNVNHYFDGDQLDYGKVHDDALAASREFGGDRFVAEKIYNRAVNALKFQKLKPDVDAAFIRLTGIAPDKYLAGIGGVQFDQLKAHYQTDYEGEVKRSQEIVSEKATDLFNQKYRPILEHTAQMYGQNSEQFRQAFANAQQALGGDLAPIQQQENARLLRVRSELSRGVENAASGILDKNQALVDNYNTFYQRAYENVQKAKTDQKSTAAYSTAYDQPGMVTLFIRALGSDLSSWAATRGAGLVAAGFNNPATDWLRSFQTNAEQMEVPGGDRLNPLFYIAKAGEMTGSMAPDILATMALKNPALSGLELTGSSTLSGMGDVYNQAKADGYNEQEAQQKAMDFAHRNFIATLPANLLMSSAIIANLKGASGLGTNLVKEAAGGLGASLPQQYLEQAQSKEGKTLGQYLREDAPQSALDNLIALAAGAPVIRAVGHLTGAMNTARVQAIPEQFYSHLIDEQGLMAAQATMELQYLNGAIDANGLTQGKKMLDDLIATKTGLSGLGVHPDLQKLYLQKQREITNLQTLKGLGGSEVLMKLMDSRIKEQEKAAQEIISGKASYLKMTTPNGVEFVIPGDRAEGTLNDPAVQRDLAAGHLRAQAFGEEKETAAITERINELNTSATNADAADRSIASPAIEPETPESPQIIEIRHGETEEDADDRVSGQDGIPLNDAGQQQIQKLADEAELRGFTRVAGSDVPRNIATAKAVADRLNIPHEIIPGFNSWDIGQWNGESNPDWNLAEHYFVDHPDATEFEGRRVNESFNQYKDRVIKARQELEEKNQGNTLLVNHSGNIGLWDAYQRSGGVWDAAAKAHYLAAPDMEPATLPPMKEQEEVVKETEAGTNAAELEQAFREEHAIDQAGDPNEQEHIGRLFMKEAKHLEHAEETNERTGPLRGLGEPESTGSQNNGENGRSAPPAADQERLPANDQSQRGKTTGESGTSQSLPDRFGSRNEFERALRQHFGMDRIVSDSGGGDDTDPYLKKASAVLKQLFPDHTIRAYDTEAEYMDREKRPAGSAGVYDPQGKYLAFNLERINKAGAPNTIYHEVIHPIVHEAMQSRPGAIDAAYSKLVEMKGTPGMENVWTHEEQYRGRGFDTMKVEAITEFLTQVADGRIDTGAMGMSLRTRVIDVINQIFKALGIDKVISTGQDIKRLADSIKQAFDQADASPVEQALGKRSGSEEQVMDALRPTGDETKLRQLTQRAPEDMTDDDISETIQRVAGWDKATADDLVRTVRGEQAKGAKQLVQEALIKGKEVAAKAVTLKTPTERSPVLKKLGRWFFDQQDDVSDVKSVIRTNKGNEEYQLDKTWKASEKLLNEWNRQPKEDQMAFILGIERPDLRQGWTSEQRQVADMYRTRLDNIYNALKNALPELNFREDYFPHFWEKPEVVKNYFASALGKSPMEGSKSFAKERIFDTIIPGLEKGYTLTTTNPEELVRLAEANAWKFITAKNIFSDMQKLGYLKYSTAKDVPANWKSVDDKLFNRIGASVTKDGEARLNTGSYVMPPDVADLMNQYLSPGLKGPVSDFIRNYNNIKNAFQLGIGAFHLGTTSLESTVSGVARGIQLLSTFDPKNMLNGLGQIAASATFVPNLTLDLRRGWKAISDYHAGLMTDDVRNLISANAKVGRQKMYSLEAKYNMMKAFGRLRADGDLKGVPKGLWSTLLYLPEMINKPLMEKWVPGLKVGGYLRSLDAELASRKNMDPRALQQAKEKIWDSMDDRLGQVVYDNRFINKTVKDLGFMSIRSLGWTGGTLAAGAKGIGEIPLSAKRLAIGEGMTQRTAYLFALPLTLGLYGAYYMIVTTGEAPETAEDYFYPRDGTKNPDGTDHRVALPSYMKDILAYGKSPVQTLVHKTSPILNDIAELYQNKDFYGAQIYGEDDPFFQRGLEKLKYIGENMEPFSFKQKPGDEKSMSEQFGSRQGLEQKFGIMPAPKERERTDLQNKIMAEVAKSGSERGKTEEEMEQIIARRHLREYLYNGGNWEDASDELKEKANVSENAIDRFIEDAKIDPYERYFKGLPRTTRIKLFEQMSPEEREEYKSYLPDDYTPEQ